ncbi:Diguanylate cyclase with GAF sensor [Cereibacter sphaeroides KD131]|nr:Diguanylate cyclase with GAF sensor [Cereibacter sphaeroides KD131]
MMQDCEKLLDEPGRLAAVRRYAVLDTAPEEPFDKLTRLVCNVLEVPYAAVTLIDADRQWFKSLVGLSGSEGPRHESFCTHTIKTRDPMIVPDATLDPRFRDSPLVTGAAGIRSYLGVPLETPDGYNLGALCAVDTAPRTFSTSQIEIMKSFASLVLDELELRQIALSDALTGAMTRRGWLAAVEKEMARGARQGTQAAIVLFDVDHFKTINDTHGHAVGDAVLQALTRRCLLHLGPADALGRIGGEEFAVLVPDAGLPEAMELAERLRRSFSDAPIEVAGQALRVTASFGVQGLDADTGNAGSWLAAADRRLYEAKAAGRNRCHGG